jgi:hypothetical protein
VSREPKSIWEVCEFEDEIIYEKLKPERFAVELYQVLEGKATELYLNPKLFLSHTYPTETMRYLLREALRRIGGRGGQPVFILDTEFGGGKTHTLLLLYYVFKDREVGTTYIRELNLHRETGILEVPECRVLAVDGRMVKRNTLWGEIAAGLGRYDDFKEEDLQRIPVRDIGKLRSLFNKPTLILLDELPHYLLNAEAVKVGDTNLCALTISFILALISAVSAAENSMLIIAMTGKQRLYEEYVKRVKKHIDELLIERVDSALREAFSRQAQYLTPIRKEEVAHILKKRLIKGVKDPKVVEEVARSYYDYLSRKGLIMDLAYEDRIKESYPFHPFLIDILYERVSTIEQFNKTRGIFRLLGLMLHRIYRDKIPCQLLSPGDILLDDPEIMDELTSRLGREGLKTVIETDCIEKARRLDEKRSVKLVERVARTILLYSLIGAERVSGALPRDVKLGVCYPGIEPDLVDEVLEEVDREFWYLKSEGEAYYFQTEPNINKIIYDYMGEVRDEEVRETIRREIEKLFPESQRVRVFIWDKNMLEDDDRLKIFIVDYRDVLGRDERTVLERLIETDPRGNIRSYRNTVIFVLPEVEGIPTLEESARRLCATEKTERDERIKLNKEMLKKVRERQTRYQGDLASDCRNVYSRIAYPRIQDGQIVVDYLEINGKIRDMTDLIIDTLEKRGKLVTSSLSPEAIRDLLSERGTLRIREVYEIFYRDKSKPFIPSGELIIEAIKNGVWRGLFGYSDKLEEHDGKYRAILGRETYMVTWDGYIIEADRVYQEEPAEIRRPVQAILETMPVRLYHQDLAIEGLKDALNKIARIRAVTPGRRFTINFNLEVEDEQKSIRITVECRDWSKIGDIERLIQTMQSFRGCSSRGSIKVETEDKELLEDMKKLGE